MNDPIVITGAGLITPLGTGVEPIRLKMLLSLLLRLL